MWDTGRQLATQGGDPWSPRAPRLNGTGPAITGRAGPVINRGWAGPGVKTTWYLMSGGLLAALGQGAVPVITYARRVGAPFPTALLGQACLLDRTGPLSVASHGPLLHGCASLPVPDVRPVLAWPVTARREAGVASVRACGVGGSAGCSCPADRVRSTSSSYASNNSVSISGTRLPLPVFHIDNKLEEPL